MEEASVFRSNYLHERGYQNESILIIQIGYLFGYLLIFYVRK